MKAAVTEQPVIGKYVDCDALARAECGAKILVVSDIRKLRCARSAISLHTSPETLNSFADVHDDAVNNKSVQDISRVRTFEKFRNKLIFRGNPFSAFDEAHSC